MSMGREGLPNKDEKLMLEALRRELSHPIPEEYQELAKAADIAPTAPSYGWSALDILKNEALVKQLEKDESNEEIPTSIDEGNLTKLGKFLREHLNGDTLIDLGSGTQVFIPNLAKALGAKRYIGVDIETTEHASRQGDFEKAVFRDDMLLFVSKLPDNYGSFFVAGAEDYSGEMTQEIYGPNVGDADTVLHPSPYMEQLLKEIFRATRRDGLLILGANNTFPDPEKVGFKSVELKDSDQANMSTAIYTKE